MFSSYKYDPYIQREKENKHSMKRNRRYKNKQKEFIEREIYLKRKTVQMELTAY